MISMENNFKIQNKQQNNGGLLHYNLTVIENTNNNLSS
jgi:hypothetical protein